LLNRQEDVFVSCLEWRQATEEDGPFLFDLTYRTMRDYLLSSRPSTEEDLKLWLKSRNERMHWFVGSWDGIPVSAISYSRLPDRINIDSIHVLPEWQNKGLGTEALFKIQHWAEEQKLPVVLQVMKNNDAAKRLYERLGFTIFHEDERNYHLWLPFVPTAETITVIEEPQDTQTVSNDGKTKQRGWLKRLFFRSKP
jgi:ribosomal protein S18 acetylase RimI-like enzyme